MTRRGFSLVETLISLALAAFLMVGTAELMLRSSHLKKRSDILTAATGLARDKLSLLRAQSFDGPGLAPGEYDEILKDPATGRAFRLAWSVELRPMGMKSLRVLVKPHGTQERGVELEMILVRSLGF